MFRMSRVGMLVLAAAVMTGCTVKPKAISHEEHFHRAHEDFYKLYEKLIPIGGPLTLEEAVARALKFNFDQQLARTEVSLQEAQFDLAIAQMLPRLSADAGYTARSNYNASESVALATGKESLAYSYSQQRAQGTADLQFSWNLLDFGVSYYQARQQGYRAMIAVERRRKVINNIVKEIRSIYWKAATAERILPRLEPVLAEAESILDKSRKLEKDRVQPPLQALEYQQNLLQLITQLRKIRTEMVQARVQLCALINVPVNASFTLKESGRAPVKPEMLDLEVSVLEELGLGLRPELREETYQERVDREGISKEILKMMPSLNIIGGLNYDTNKYLYNNGWSELGVRATYNLVNLVQGPLAIKSAKTTQEVTKMRRLALSVAVLTQINVSYQQYLRTMEALNTAVEIEDVQHRISQTVSNASEAATVSDFERIRRFLNATIAELDRDRAFSDVQMALGNLYGSVGLDLVPPGVVTGDLGPLTEEVRLSIAAWEKGQLPPIPAIDGIPANLGQTGASRDGMPVAPAAPLLPLVPVPAVPVPSRVAPAPAVPAAPAQSAPAQSAIQEIRMAPVGR